MQQRQCGFEIALALLTTLIVGFGIVSNVHAQSTKTHSEVLRQLLRGIDTVPTRTQLTQAASEPVDALFAVVIDPSASLYERRRATSLLAMFESPAAEAYLTLLATVASDQRIRWVAMYSYCRGWARRAPKRVLTFAKLMLASPNPNIREAVVLGLRFVKQPAAHQLLLAGKAQERHPRVQAVYKRVLHNRNTDVRPAKTSSQRERTK